MAVSAQQIKDLREKTGAGVSDVKKALEESQGDEEKAIQWLERKLGSLAVKRGGRTTGAGIVEAYIHSNSRVGVLLELFCETDFVARNPQFKGLAHDLALHIAAMRPLYLSLDLIPRDIWDAEKMHVEEEVSKMGKPSAVAGEIISGKLSAHFEALTLLSQPFVKDEDKTVGDMVNEAIGKFGENIKIGKFVRFEI